MAYALDILLLVILAVSVFVGIKKGFAEMLVRTVGTVLAVVLAVMLSAPIAETAFDSLFASGVKDTLIEQLPAVEAGSVSDGVQDAIDAIPPFLLSFVKQQEVDVDAIAAHIETQTAETSGNVSALIADAVTTHVVRPIAVTVMTVAIFFILLIVLLIAVWLLSKVVKRIFKLPVLKTLNKTLGGVLGLVQGLVWVLVAVTVMEFAFVGTDSIVSRETLEQTVLVSRICDANPLTTGFNEIAAGIGDRIQNTETATK